MTNTISKNNNGIKSLAWLMIFIFVSSLFIPNQTFAGGGGPTQPEVQGFTPIGVSDMVDPFTGDFTYNIPLMDVEGYPINIAYNSGVSMDQEASWVGLGWSLNMGSVVRSMRGLPDDFNGDIIEKTVSQKPTTNIGLNFAASAEILGASLDGVLGNSGGNLSFGMGFTYNNYNGFGTDINISPSFNFGKGGTTGTVGFGLSGSSENGASFSPSISLSHSSEKNKNKDYSLKNTIGASLNSRAGLQNVSYSSTMSKKAFTMVSGMNRKGGAISKKQYDSGSVGGAFDLGLHQYSPSAGPSMFGGSISGNFNFGSSVFGLDGSWMIGFTFSRQWIPLELQTIKSPAYGYFSLDKGQKNEKALLDFNRDNEGPFTKYSLNLPSAQLMYDMYSVQAQGTGGSFRGFRNDIGYVFDPKVTSSDVSGSAGFEFGFGSLADLGVDISLNYTHSSSGLWKQRNEAISELSFHKTTSGNIIGPYTMQEANERAVDKDLLITDQYLGSKTAYFPLGTDFPGLTKLKSEVKHSSTVTEDLTENIRANRIITNNSMSFLTNAELNNGLGINNLHSNIYINYKGHHIGEIVQLGMDGRRYVFGIAAYNHFQEDATFAIGRTIGGTAAPVTNDDFSGLTNYASATIGDELASKENEYGLDNYYSSQTTPPYSHSHLLTAVLSDDYIDSDDIKGPSDEDLGSFVKFDYNKIDKHKWRTPIQKNTAYYNEGLKTDDKDDKASFVYGEKDLWYVKAVETKNYIAVFELESREDGNSALGRHGGLDLNDANAMKALKKITLYSKPDYQKHINDLSQATPLQEVNFHYSYKLCVNYPNNLNAAPNNGKLTLTEISFTYQGSKKMKKRSYKFEYNGLNPEYNLKASDRWGTYMPTNSVNPSSPLNPNMTTADYPYTLQDKTLIDQYAGAWSLTDIKLPSGGGIKVDYESDDYGFVQHKQAAQMFKIVAVGDTPNSFTLGGFDGTPTYANISRDDIGSYEKNKDIFFELNNQSDDLSQYASIGQQLYFRVLMDFRENASANNPGKCEYVSGYGKITALQKVEHDGKTYGRITFQGEELRDTEGANYSPITKAALQFGRMHLSRYIFEQPSSNVPDDSEQSILDFANSVAGSITSFGEYFTGPNKAIYNKDRGVNLVLNKSWIRLKEPTGTKLGGGSRVKKIRMYDSWGEMTTGNTSDSYSYGQVFEYKLENGKSSGVASYEPQIGGDENPWHSAYVVNNKKRFAMDDKLYLEDPIMESQFPSPSIGYSRVVIKDLNRDNVIRTATGRIVKEFYTAKDFPTIVSNSSVIIKTKNSFLPLLPKYQYLNASQGFVIELNDMHGKPKKESVFAENKEEPISTVEYIYQSDDLFLNGANNKKLNNTVQVIDPSGQLSSAEIGVKYDVVADFRESETQSLGGRVRINTNTMLFGAFPAIIPTVYPSLDATENRFRSATINKTVYRFGVLSSTRADQDGSKVETNNMAYDSQTGEVLITQTATNFNDKIYSLNYPAYWNYEQLGAAYINLGYLLHIPTFTNTGFAPVALSKNHFVPGDEVSVQPYTGSSYAPFKAWVTEVSSSGIVVIKKDGNPVTVQNALIKIIRSGRRNKQTTSMASLTSLSDPRSGIQSNQYMNVLNAGAVEFGDVWKTYCNCFKTGPAATTNPYVLGIKGNWRPVRSFTHLSGRTQSDYDNNTNIRKDGVFTSYTPYYKNVSGNWNVNGLNWTYVSEVTQFSPNGMALETKDALGRYSASHYGFNNTLTTAVAANTQLKQLAFGNFEDFEYSNCMDQGFFNQIHLNNQQEPIPAVNISSSVAHTGRNSIKVAGGTSIIFKNIVSSCEESVCNLNLTQIAGKNEFVISNGTAPYQIETNLISGSGNADLNPNGIVTVTYATNQYFEIEVSLTDANGCAAIFKISRPQGNPNQINLSIEKIK